MSPAPFTLLVHDALLAVARLGPREAVPVWAWSGPLVALARTPAELSIVCDASAVPPGVVAEGPWRALEVAGPLDFGLTGVIHNLTAPLAAAGISVFVFSTFDTDYLLVRASSLDAACAALREAGHAVATRAADGVPAVRPQTLATRLD